MAGAVSAGAYTAGVVDYLMETLERWQQKKDELRKKLAAGIPLTSEEQLVPMHDVVIEVLSGASAGGMTAAVLAYSMNDGTHITTRSGKLIDGNYNIPVEADNKTKLYDSWINMADDTSGTTFSKLMNPSDVVPITELKSLLNSEPIDEIAQRAIPEKIDFNAPAYISNHVSVILSVTNLEGIPIDIRFSNVDQDDPTCNVLKMHSGFLHYQFKEQLLAIDYPAEIISEASKDHLAAAAKATGAFPFGLSNRKIEINQIFFNEFKKRLKENYKIDVNLELPPGENYTFNAVDGGAINNEPIGITARILECKKTMSHPNDENYLILIDPFPTVTNAAVRTKYSEPKEYTLIEQAGKLISAIRNQSMFRQEDLLNGLEMDKNRFLIYPTKRKYYFLACGLVGGFSGFLKKEFREHDYQLGRKNCQAFLRFYFGEPVEQLNQLTGFEISQEQVLKWRYNSNYGKNNRPEAWKLPLIPDMLLLQSDDEIVTPTYQGLSLKEMQQVCTQIEKRLVVILDKSYSYLKAKGSSIHWLLGRFMGICPRFFKRQILSRIEKALRAYMHETFLPQSIKQEQLLLFYLQQILKHGKQYQKTAGVWVRIAEGGERVVSILKDGKETQNTASKGDYIVRNGTEAQEEYIVKPEKFKARYVPVKADYYKPNEEARVYALQITTSNISKYRLEGLQQLCDGLNEPLYIEASWHESQLLRLNDFLVVSPTKDEVYRIAQKEFHETYSLL